MPVAVAHQTSRYSPAVLAEAVREAAQRGEELFVISVEKAADEDHRAALTASIGDDLVAAASSAQVPLAPWTLELEAATSEVEDTADATAATRTQQAPAEAPPRPPRGSHLKVVK